MNYAAVITAGGRVEGAFAQALGTPVKALAPYRGSTFVRIAIDAARAAGISSVAVVGGTEVAAACQASVDKLIPESKSGVENLRRALRAWDSARPLLYLTSDMPFLTPAALTQFLVRTPSTSLALPLTEWPDFQRRFPGAPPFGVTLGGERVVNGGAFIIPAGAQDVVERAATQCFDARKSPWRMAAIAGPMLLLRFVLGRLRVGHLESRATALFGVDARAVRGAPPELAYDVDVLEEYEYACSRRD